MKIFGFEITKAKNNLQVTVDDQLLYRMLFETMSPYLKLNRDSDLLDTITEGYEMSPDVFGIVNKITTMFSRIPYKVMRGETELDEGPIEGLFKNNASDYTFQEFMCVWESMGLITGNAIVYYVTRSGVGDVIHLQIAPSQHVEIIYGGWLNPVKGYKLDLAADDSKLIPTENIWHTRHFPNLDFREGKNYMGLSPVRVAAKIINSQIFGQELVEASYKRGMPPGILYRKDAGTTELKLVEQQRKSMEEVWDRKYGDRSKAGKPVFSVGDLGWLKIGFDSMANLQVTEVNKMALRALCNVWGIPSRVMNDMEGGSYTKDKEDRKAIYTNRLIPDTDLFWKGINRLIEPTGIQYVPDYSQIPEMQEDKKEMTEIYQIGFNCNAVQVNELREKLQLEPDPQMEGLYKSDVDTGMNQLGQMDTLLPKDKL